MACLSGAAEACGLFVGHGRTTWRDAWAAAANFARCHLPASRRSAYHGVVSHFLLILAACPDPAPVVPAPGASCDDVALRDVASPDDLEALHHDVQAVLHPDLEGVAVELVTMTSEADFFYANLDLTTLANDPRERSYRVYYNQGMFEDLGVPPFAGLVAILGHELKHVQDYTEMDAEEMAQFGVWYATSDVSDYERATDEFVLERGCGPGLIAFREFLYDHVSDEVEAQKRHDYYTPEEIEAWMAEHD